MELIDAIRQSASRKDMPDNLLGYGIPNFGLAGDILTDTDAEDLLSPSTLEIYPNPASGHIRAKLAEHSGNSVHYRIFGMDGRLWSQGIDRLSTDGSMDIPLSGLPGGNYILHIQDADAIHRGLFIKSR
jgi:hypothetical protein